MPTRPTARRRPLRFPARLVLCLLPLLWLIAACQPAPAGTPTGPRPTSLLTRPATTVPEPIITPTPQPATQRTPSPTAALDRRERTDRPATPVLSQPTATARAWEKRAVIGASTQGRLLEVTHLGRGPRWFVVIGGLHGGHECSTADLVFYLIDRLRAAPEWLPADVTLFLLPLANPDGCALDTRHNANDVDLNRNWETPDWTPDVFGPNGPTAGGGGETPFSEPETRVLRAWLLALQNRAPGPVVVLTYHAAVPPNGLVLPGYQLETGVNPVAADLAELYATLAGYDYGTEWVGNYPITGEFVHWADRNGFVAADVELPDRNGIHFVPAGGVATHGEINLTALLSTTTLFLVPPG